MTDATTSIHESVVMPKRPSGLITVVSLFSVALGCLLECIQTVRNPRPLRIIFAVAYFLAAIFVSSYAVRRIYLNVNPPLRWNKSDPKLLLTRVLMISATLLMMGCVAGNLVHSAGPIWRVLADDAFPWLFVLNFQPDFFTERFPLSPPWPQTPVGKLWNSLRRTLSRRKKDATQR